MTDAGDTADIQNAVVGAVGAKTTSAILLLAAAGWVPIKIGVAKGKIIINIGAAIVIRVTTDLEIVTKQARALIPNVAGDRRRHCRRRWCTYISRCILPKQSLLYGVLTR